MPSDDPARRFADILDNIARIARFTGGLDRDAFLADERARFAVERALLIISEAATKLGELAGALCPGIPWREVRGLGNRLRHDYDLIEDGRIWELVQRDLPALDAACRDALRRLRGEHPG